MRRALQRTPSQSAAGTTADIEDTAQEIAVAFAPIAAVAPASIEVPAPRILKNAVSRAAAAAAAAATAAVPGSIPADSSPVPALSASPEPSSWDLSDLIAQYASASPSPEADDADEEEEDEEEEEIEPEAEVTAAPRRIVSLVGSSSGGNAATNAASTSRSDRREDRLAPNTKRFLGNLLRGTVSHNERVEHVVLAMRGCDNGGVEAEAAEITVYDPRGTYNGLSLSKSAATAAAANAVPKLRAAAASGRNVVLNHDTSAVAASGSLEAEARKLMAAFEGSTVGGGGGGGLGRAAPARKVRGRGRALAGMKDSTCNVAVRDDVDMSEMASQHRNSAAGTASAKGSTVAASHLHTPEQRAAYQQTHDKYKRARGVTLLHHIAQAYGISIRIQPAGTAAESSDEEIDAAAALLEKQAAKAKAAKALGSAAAVTPSAAPAAAAARPARLFTTSLSSIGQPARSFSNPSVGGASAETVPAAASIAASSQSSDGTRVRITLQRSLAAESSPSPPVASPSPPAPAAAASFSSVRRTFDSPLVSSPEAMSDMSDGVSASSSSAAPNPTRKIVTLAARSSNQSSTNGDGATVPAAAAVATSAASSQPHTRAPVAAAGRPPLQLNRKRKESDEGATSNGSAAITAHASTPPATLSASSPAMVRSSSLGATPAVASGGGSGARVASIPLAKRKRTGGILGAALSGILGGSVR